MIKDKYPLPVDSPFCNMINIPKPYPLFFFLFERSEGTFPEKYIIKKWLDIYVLRY